MLEKYRKMIEAKYSNDEEFRIVVDILNYFHDRHGKAFIRDAVNSIELLSPEIKIQIDW